MPRRQYVGHAGTTEIHPENVVGRGKFKYQYPLNNKEFPARVVFKVIPNIDTGGVVGAAVNLVEAGISTGTDAVKHVTETVNNEQPDVNEIQNLGKQKNNIVVSSARTGIQRTRSWIDQQAAFYGSVAEEPAYDETMDVTADECHLYLPRAINVTDTATYDTGFQLGVIGGVAEQALTEGRNVLGAVAGATLGGAIAEGRSFMSGTNMGSGVADILAQKRIAKMGATGEAIAGGMTAASKVTTNPNTRAMFKDVPLRAFGFGFTMIPTSSREADEVENIVKFFREQLYPTTLSAGKVRVGYKFPNRFKIQLRHGFEEGRRRGELGVKFLPCYLTSFAATYNQNSPMIHADGQFNQVDITLSFTESRALTKADVRDGGY